MGTEAKGWLDASRERGREKQTRRSNFTWRNDYERQVLLYRVEVGRPLTVSTRDKLHTLLTTTKTEWVLMGRQDVKTLLREGYRHIGHKEVFAALEKRRPATAD
jgi:hypothetical protein